MSRERGEITVRVFRYDPERDDAPRYEVHRLPRRPHMRVLDALNHVYEEAPDSLAHRWYCGTKKCGECALSVNGAPRLGCWEPALDDMTCEPLTNFPIVRDLVVDTAPYEQLIMELRPFLSRSVRPAFPERLPHAGMAAAHRLSKCIECNVCTAAVAVKSVDAAGVHWWGWPGPAALVRFARFALDPRDETERGDLARRAGLAEFPDFPSLDGICPQGIDIAADALAPARRALFGEIPPPPAAPEMRRVFVIARGFSAFLNLSEALYRELCAAGALEPLAVDGIDRAFRLTL